MKIEVFLSEGEPRAIFTGRRSLRIEFTEDRWDGEGMRYFKVICADRARYILKNDPSVGSWEVILFERVSDPPKEAG